MKAFGEFSVKGSNLRQSTSRSFVSVRALLKGAEKQGGGLPQRNENFGESKQRLIFTGNEKFG